MNEPLPQSALSLVTRDQSERQQPTQDHQPRLPPTTAGPTTDPSLPKSCLALSNSCRERRYHPRWVAVHLQPPRTLMGSRCSVTLGPASRKVGQGLPAVWTRAACHVGA